MKRQAPIWHDLRFTDSVWNLTSGGLIILCINTLVVMSKYTLLLQFRSFDAYGIPSPTFRHMNDAGLFKDVYQMSKLINIICLHLWNKSWNVIGSKGLVSINLIFFRGIPSTVYVKSPPLRGNHTKLINWIAKHSTTPIKEYLPYNILYKQITNDFRLGNE